MCRRLLLTPEPELKELKGVGENPQREEQKIKEKASVIASNAVLVEFPASLFDNGTSSARQTPCPALERQENTSYVG